MRREHDPVLDNHVCRFKSRLKQQCVRRFVRDVGRSACEYAAIKDRPEVKLAAIRIGYPIELTIDEVDATGFEARIRVHSNKHRPGPRIGLGVVGATQPVAFVAVSVVDISGACVERILVRVVGHAVNVSGDDRVTDVAKQRCAGLGSRLLKSWILPERISDFHGLATVG